jgi:hypothetical protein
MLSDGAKGMYWADKNTNLILAASLDGAKTFTVATERASATAFAADAERFYWINGGSFSVYSGSL